MNELDNAPKLELVLTILVLKDADACKKLEDKAPIEALKEAVAALSSASVAKVASKDELNCSRLDSLVLVEPLITKKLDDRAPRLELVFDILVLNEADACKKLEDTAPIEELFANILVSNEADVEE